MSKKYNLYRLSSTRELAMRTNKNSSDISNAVIYGGIDYKQENPETMPTAEQTEETNSNIELIRDIRGSVSGISYLPGTKTEAESIAKILIANNKCNEAKLLTGKTGTENSFKSISGEDIKIIHIATHGFYYKGNNNTEDLSLANASQSESEDKSLTRSGLLFAGAEKTIFADSQQPSNNDCILTALEISTMDLRALDIVTLSACQTGQGDITNDGVFGLQRGFKKAGANSILMSLWSVDDRATSLLMTEFYKNWIAGKSKHDALEIAKQSVKEHKENGWDNPKYWAAFILLDGLD
jgi:CHAT domain-containing protein